MKGLNNLSIVVVTSHFEGSIQLPTNNAPAYEGFTETIIFTQIMKSKPYQQKAQQGRRFMRYREGLITLPAGVQLDNAPSPEY